MNRKSLILCLILCACTMVASAKEWQIEMPTYSDELKKQASLENVRAYTDLAICYGYGIGVKMDKNKCVKMFKNLGLDYNNRRFVEECALLVPYSTYWYGIFLCDHSNNYYIKKFKWLRWDKNYDKKIPETSERIKREGIDYIFAAADIGHLYDAMMFAARTERNSHKSYDYNRSSGYNDNVRYSYYFGYYQEAMKRYQKACETGNTDAMVEYGNYLISMVEKSGGQFEDAQDELAVYWIKTAAEAGNEEAQFLYGNMYSTGWQYRVPKDLNKAIEWYKKSADNGYAPAMGFAAKHILASSAPDKETVALKYLQMGVENNDGCSACELGKYYKSTNPELAFKNFQIAGNQMHPEGLYELGNALYYGLGTTADLKAAAQAYETCAGLDIIDEFVGRSALKLADMYENGKGIFMNKDRASYYRRIAEQYDLN